MECNKVIELMPGFQEGLLASSEEAEIGVHLDTCLKCQKEEQTLSATWDMLGVIKPIQPSPDFRAQFWQKVQQEEEKRKWFTGLFSPWPRLVPVLGSIMVIGLLGLSSGLFLFDSNHRATDSPTQMGLAIFTSPYPENSIEEIFLGAGFRLASHGEKP